jgi:TonB-linked SusC/RagA family outer membrane protein
MLKKVSLFLRFINLNIMTRILSLFVVFMLTGALAFSQSRVVTGKVTTADGTVIPYASVSIQGSKNAGTVADANGAFGLKTKEGDVLNISGTGFKSTQVTVSSSNNLNIIVERGANTELASVVVTGLGIQRQAKSIGTSVTKVTAKEITAGRSVNLQNGLTGKVSGLNIQTVNSSVFGDTRITLRGIRSLTGNNQPMLILDGVPIALNYISSINPNDIQDVTILKSSSSTAIYGPDGVNGAILVTLKKGTKGGKANVTLSHTTQFEKVAYLPKFQTKFGSGSSSNSFGVGVYDPIENQGYGDPFDGSIRQIGRTGPNGEKFFTEYSARTNEKLKFWETGITNQTDISLSAGDFYLSAQNVDISGLMPKDKNKRITLSMRSGKDISEKLRASFNVNYTKQDYNVNAGNQFGNGRDRTPAWNLYNSPAQIPITKFKNWQTDYFSSPDGYFNDYYYNPYWLVDSYRQKGKSDDFFGNIEFNYKFNNWISATYRLGSTISSSSAKSTAEAFNYSLFAKASGKSNSSNDVAAEVQDFSSTSSRINSEIFVTARKEYNKFKLELLLGQSFRETNAKNVNVSSDNLGIESVFNVSVRKGEPGASEGTSRTKLERYFGRASIGYNNWAFAEFTGSYDIDSRLVNPYDFNKKKISFFYPGTNVSFVLTDAISGLKNKTLSYLKLRGALSKTGNVNLGAYSLENTYSSGEDFPFGNVIGFTSNNTLRQASYKPEFVLNKEVGLEVGFFNNKVNIEASAYTQDNTNQLITVAYSAATGFPSALLNAASFTNKGLELDLKLTPIVKLGDFNLDLKFNYAYQENVVNSLIDGVDELGIGNGNFIIKGASAYTFKLTDYKRDSVGRVIVDKVTGYPSVDPVVKQFGQTIPKHIFGINVSANWKNISFTAVADFRTGNQIFAGVGADLDFSGLSYRSGLNDRRPFVFPNSSYDDGNGKYVANTAIYTQDGGYNFWSQGATNTNINSNYLSSGAFWKLREIALSYNFPRSLFDGKGIKGATFSITGRNLLTWLPSSNEWTDPEFSNTTGNAQGVSNRNNNPPSRIFGANLTLQF